MLFDKKVKRGMEVMRERNKQYLEGFEGESGRERTDPEDGEVPDDAAQAQARLEEYRRANDDVGLEKGDIPALILSALLVFGPIILMLAAILALAWIWLH